MEITRETVNAWLSDHRRDREWLAIQCDVGVRAVGNWLNTKGEARPIPAEHQITISKLMDEDAAAAQAKPPHNLVLEFLDNEFAPIEQAALAARLTIRDWAKQTLNQAAELDVEKFAVQMGLVPVDSPDDDQEDFFWIDLQGGIAAGSQITSDDAPEPIKVGKEYEDGCYALRVFGRSMEPKIPEGSLIIVRPFLEKGFPRKGTIVVYSDGMGRTLKEFGYRKASPDEEGDTFGNVPVLRSINKAFSDVQTMEGGRIEAVFVEVATEAK